METNLPEGFTVFRFARSTWRRIRTNNGLENLNRQIRRRTRVVGIFPNTESALRLITAVVEEIHEDWLIGKSTSAWSISNHRRIRSQITLSQITEKQLLSPRTGFQGFRGCETVLQERFD